MAWVTHRDLGAPPLPTAIVDVSGVPHVVLGPDQQLPPGTVQARIDAVADRLGTLVIDGRLLPRVWGMCDPVVCRVLREHESCMTEEGRSWALTEIFVMAVEIDRLRLSEAGVPSGPEVAVPSRDFRDAESDAWAVAGDEVISHLESHHQHDLRELVKRMAGVRATAVVVKSLDRTGGVLAAMSDDGLRDVRVEFAPHAMTPQHAMARLRAAADGRTPGR